MRQPAKKAKSPTRAWVDLGEWSLPAQQTGPTVSDDIAPRPTGLLDQHGNPIVKAPPRIGFLK